MHFSSNAVGGIMQKNLYNSYFEQMKFQPFPIAFSLLYMLTTNA